MEGIIDHPQKYYFRELYNTNPTKEKTFGMSSIVVKNSMPICRGKSVILHLPFLGVESFLDTVPSQKPNNGVYLANGPSEPRPSTARVGNGPGRAGTRGWCSGPSTTRRLLHGSCWAVNLTGLSCWASPKPDFSSASKQNITNSSIQLIQATGHHMHYRSPVETSSQMHILTYTYTIRSPCLKEIFLQGCIIKNI
jgi:hypothetical protein